jgi:hypothetical protein
VSILPGFLRQDALPGLVAECDTLVFANNREATAVALALGRAGRPVAAEVVAPRESAWNPFYRPA